MGFELEALVGEYLLQVRAGNLSKAELNQREQAITHCIRASLTCDYDWQLHQSQLDALRLMKSIQRPVSDELIASVTRLRPDGILASEVAIKLIQHHYERGELSKAATLAMEHRSSLDGFENAAFLPAVEYRLSQGESRKSITQDFVAMIEARENTAFGFTDWMLLRLLNTNDDLAMERAAGFEEALRSYDDELSLGRCWVHAAQRMSNKSSRSNDEILGEIEGELEPLQVPFLLGVAELADGNRSEAKRLFQIATRSRCFHKFNYGWCRIFLERVDDPNWLSWLENGAVRAPYAAVP